MNKSVWNLQYDINELIYETDSQTQRTNCGCQGGGGWGKDGLGVSRIDKQQGPTL